MIQSITIWFQKADSTRKGLEIFQIIILVMVTNSKELNCKMPAEQRTNVW